jgi:phage terminase small subunit
MTNKIKRKAIRKKSIPREDPEKNLRQHITFNKPFATRRYQLPHKVQILCEEYLRNGFDKSAAAKVAGYSIRTANAIFNRKEVNDYIQNKIDKVYDNVTENRILREITRLSLVTMKDVMKWDKDSVTIIPSDELTNDVAAAIQEVSMEEVEFMAAGGKPGKVVKKVKVKLHSGKLEALKTLGAVKGMFQEGRFDADEVADRIKDAYEKTISGFGLPTVPQPSVHKEESQVLQEEQPSVPVSDIVKH